MIRYLLSVIPKDVKKMTIILMYLCIMKIPNYNIVKKENKKRRLDKFLDEEYPMLVYGQSTCGKTNTIVHAYAVQITGVL